MSSLKIKSLALAVALGGSASLLSACGVVYSDSTDDSLRTPTGYYEHTDSKAMADPVKSTADGSKLYKDNTFAIPLVATSAHSKSLVGKNMDVRPPVVSQVVQSGVDIVSKDDAALVWFLPFNSFNILNEDAAWRALNTSIALLKLPVAERDDAQYVIKTASAEFNDFGEPYDKVSSKFLASKFNQRYEIKVGQAPQGQVGFSVSLLSSEHENGDTSLTAVQRNSFNVGFANTLIKTLSMHAQGGDVVPDYVNIILGRDNNAQDALIVSAPYNSTWNVMRGTLEQYGMSVEEYSISRSTYTVKVSEEDPEFYRNLGVEPFGLADGEYILRLAVSGDNTVITFYDEDDKPLSANQVAALYAGFSKAISQQFALYKREGVKYLDKFAEED